MPDKSPVHWTVSELCSFGTVRPFRRALRRLPQPTDNSDVLYRPFETLSNGERTKVLLAALFLNEGHFLLIDEPTNHLDTKARELVSAYLKRKKGFILVSHDRMFLDACRPLCRHTAPPHRKRRQEYRRNIAAERFSDFRRFVPQDTSHLRGGLSELAEKSRIDESLFKAILRKMGFERVQFEKDIGDFSEGQKKKVQKL